MGIIYGLWHDQPLHKVLLTKCFAVVSVHCLRFDLFLTSLIIDGFLMVFDKCKVKLQPFCCSCSALFEVWPVFFRSNFILLSLSQLLWWDVCTMPGRGGWYRYFLSIILTILICLTIPISILILSRGRNITNICLWDHFWLSLELAPMGLLDATRENCSNQRLLLPTLAYFIFVSHWWWWWG